MLLTTAGPKNQATSITFIIWWHHYEKPISDYPYFDNDISSAVSQTAR